MSDVWAGIVRVSHMGSRGQADDAFHAERDQVAAMTRSVRDVGGTLHVLPPELDVSGGLPLARRPSLLEAVEGVEQGRYRGIVVAYHSRLGRDTLEEEMVWRRVERAGGSILMALDGIDTTTVDGQMLRRIRSAMNHAERDRHKAAFEERVRVATEAGIWQARQAPTGYRKDPDTRRLVPDDRAADVRQAFLDRPAGVPIVRIAERLRMTSSGVRQLLRNRVYLGELRSRSYVKVDAHPAIVSVEEWEAAQIGVARGPRSDREPALLAGLVRCQGCGHVMSRQGGRGRPEVYTCHGRSSAGRCTAPAAATLAKLDELVSRAAVHELSDVKGVTADEAREGVDAAAYAVRRAQVELAGYLEAVSVEDVGVHAFREGARARRDRVATARDAWERARATTTALIAVDDRLWEGMSAHERNQLLRGLLECVVVRKAGRGSRIPIAERVTILRRGMGLVHALGRRGEQAGGVVPIVLAELDRESVIRVPGAEDRDEGARG